jgi:hypothetical protein
MATEEAVDDIVRARKGAGPIALVRRLWLPSRKAVGRLRRALSDARSIKLRRGALHGIGITPWNPSTGLAMALLIIKGPRYAPLIMVAELLWGTTLPIAPISPVPVSLGSLVVKAGYTGAAAILRHAGLLFARAPISSCLIPA